MKEKIRITAYDIIETEDGKLSIEKESKTIFSKNIEIVYYYPSETCIDFSLKQKMEFQEIFSIVMIDHRRIYWCLAEDNKELVEFMRLKNETNIRIEN